MTFNKQLLPGALVVAGLVACGGEAQNLADETGYVESPLTTVTILTGANETVTCYETGLTYYSGGFECWLAANFTHQYRAGYSVTIAPTSTKQFIPTNGLIDGGPLAGGQLLYAGPGNGMVAFMGNGKGVSIAGTTLQDRMVNQGFLATDTCLKKYDGTQVACAGGQWTEFWAPPNGSHLHGYLAYCTGTTNITCP